MWLSDHRATIATGTGDPHLGRGALLRSRRRSGCSGSLRPSAWDQSAQPEANMGDADGENAPLMQRLAYRRIIDPEIARHRVDPESLRAPTR